MKADVTVHIDEELDDPRTVQICDEIAHLEGVINVHCAEQREHLLVVEYNIYATNSRDILNQVERSGLHAELIGM
jgi:hypothetical protein